ncbi:GNAT family N-acetyltransferase [Methanobacterium subterraneum]|uniref:GNAT family N-acetyltransferase n=1 Tax=Methanobacterium subterraneum TaxID=59277 RepID=A0A2H4VEL3_9EURY|nr:GNAT family N-acetyltransferase [Methanobacterium subterraneum]AUB56538.1 GNAT family N-acetyltransferase [Methanobacterium subterraneum]
MSKRARLIKESELEQLLSLYEYLIPEDPKLEIDSTLKKHWDDILSDPSLFYVVVEEDGKLVSSCNITIIKNLTREAKPYGLIENVIIHPDYRNKGYGTLVLEKALEIAGNMNCYKVMLMTSRKDEKTFHFYEKSGFDRREKTAFVLRICIRRRFN